MSVDSFWAKMVIVYHDYYIFGIIEFLCFLMDVDSYNT